MSASTSPTLKRERIIQEAILPETESMEIEEDCLNDLSTSFEDMEIADSEDDLFISRSKLIDEKVIEKQRRNASAETKTSVLVFDISCSLSVMSGLAVLFTCNTLRSLNLNISNLVLLLPTK